VTGWDLETISRLTLEQSRALTAGLNDLATLRELEARRRGRL